MMRDTLVVFARDGRVRPCHCAFPRMSIIAVVRSVEASEIPDTACSFYARWKVKMAYTLQKLVKRFGA
jgi:hypothetical protein